MNKTDRVLLLMQFGYIGERFHGVQRQPNLPTVAEALRARLREAAAVPPKALVFAARTDAGVSALSNVATCWFPPLPNLDALILDLQREREDGILGLRVQRAPYTVHARGISRGKRYRYLIETGHEEDAGSSPYVWKIYPKLHGNLLQSAAALLRGKHDFSSFRAAGCSAATPIKHLRHIGIAGPFTTSSGHQRWAIEFEGDAFLRKMIRVLVGTLVEVGTQWRPVQDVPRILSALSRAQAGVTAPARGLCLSQVGCGWPEDGRHLIFAAHAVSDGAEGTIS